MLSDDSPPRISANIFYPAAKVRYNGVRVVIRSIGPPRPYFPGELPMLRQAISLCALVLGLCTTCFGQVTLEHKFTEGSAFTVDSTEQVEQKLTINGTDIETGSNTRATVKGTVGQRDADGKLRVPTKIESLKINVSIMGMPYDFDSANPDAKGDSQLEALRDVHRGLVKRTTTLVYDKSNRVTAVENDVDILSSLPAEAQAMAKSQLDPGHLKDAANDAMDEIKSDPIKPGDTWQRSSTTDFGAGQVMQFKTEYTYAGTVAKDGRTLDKITSKTLEVNYSLQDSPLPLGLKNSDLKATESDGTILFDRELGRVVESTTSMRITGDLTFTINDTNLPAKLDLKMQKSSVVK
jgi:hypothetical protein